MRSIELSYTIGQPRSAGPGASALLRNPMMDVLHAVRTQGSISAAARSIGLSVPEDLSIIGVDDTAIAAHNWPPMTTVRWPIQAMAKAAAIKLIDPVEARSQPSHFLSDLIERASVATA